MAGWTDALAPVTSTGVCAGEAQGSRTWLGHSEAGRALAQRQAKPAALLMLQHAVRARPAGARAVPHLRAGLHLHLAWKRDRAAQVIPASATSSPEPTGSQPQEAGGLSTQGTKDPGH